MVGTVTTMEWPFNDPYFTSNDLNNVLRYNVRPCAVRLRMCGTKDVVQRTIETDKEWEAWFSDDEFLLHGLQLPGLGVILAARAEEYNSTTHNSSILEYLPFSRQVFDRLINTLPLHGDTIRILNRSDHAIFESIDLRPTPWNSIFYCCRTTSKYAGDVAVSSVFYPNSGFTAAVFLGCNGQITENITGRIRNAENSTSHPLLVMGFLVEIERERHVKLVDSQVRQLLGRIYALSSPEEISMISSMHADDYSLESWIRISELRSDLMAWEVQLSRMVEHIDELEENVFADPSLSGSCASLQSDSSNTEVEPHDDGEVQDDYGKPSFHQSACDEANANWRQHGRHSGRRIKKRLVEIMQEYDENIRKCTIFIDGLPLATQMSWNQIGYQDTQTNLRIASDTKRDSSQMRSIALLTMVFLPAMFVSSVFSMTFFNWHPGTGEDIISSYMWIYPVVVAAVTVTVLSAWYVYSKRRSGAFEQTNPV